MISKCIGCSKCCYSKSIMFKVLIDESEVEKFKDNYFVLDGRNFLKMVVWGEYTTCVFLDTDKFICSIYNERPRVCREFKEDGDFCKQLINEKKQ